MRAPDGELLLFFIDVRGVQVQAELPPEYKHLPEGYYTPQFKLIQRLPRKGHRNGTQGAASN